MAGRDTERRDGSLPAQTARRERGWGLRALGHSVSRIAAPIAAKRGGGVLARLKAEWSAVVGPELGAISWPDALGRDGALRLRAAAGFALDLQHCTPLIIERINLFFGRAAVTRITLIQAPLPFAAPPPAAAPERALGADERRALDDRLAGIDNPELRDALARLGRTLLARDADEG